MTDGGRQLACADPQPIEAEDVGFYVPALGEHCPRCGDVNQTDDRLCITCTYGAFAYRRPDGTWHQEGPRTLREGT